MRCVYDDYKTMSEKSRCAIAALSNLLKNLAHHFYNQTIGGYAISEIAYQPNEILIDDVAVNTISDFDRVIAYHAIETPTRYKYAAYVGFWWQRSKPFACKLHDYKEVTEEKWNDPCFMDLCKSLNELFLTDFMLFLIQMQRKPIDGLCANLDMTFSHTDLQDSLFYFLKYRHYTAQELELFLNGLATCPLTIYPSSQPQALVTRLVTGSH